MGFPGVVPGASPVNSRLISAIAVPKFWAVILYTAVVEYGPGPTSTIESGLSNVVSEYTPFPGSTHPARDSVHPAVIFEIEKLELIPVRPTGFVLSLDVT